VSAVVTRRGGFDGAKEIAHRAPKLMAPLDAVVARASQSHGFARTAPSARQRRLAYGDSSMG